MPANADFEPLTALLDQQLNLYRKVLTLMEQQREAITVGEVETLDRLVRAQAAELRLINAAEKKRQQAVRALCAGLGLGPDAVSLGELIHQAAPEQQNTLAELQDNFALVASQLRLANDTNSILLQTNIELNEMLLSLFMDKEDPLNNFYRADGSERAEKLSAPSWIDQQI